MVVKTEEEFWSFVERGYTPYLMRSQNRWYMRRGQRRHIIARELEGLAGMVAAELTTKRGPPIRAGVIQEMRRRGSLVEGIAEDTGVSRGALCGAFERGAEELVRPRITAKAVPRVLIPDRPADSGLVHGVKRLLEGAKLLGRMRRERKGCFEADEGVCTRGLSEGVQGLEFVKHEHSAPIPFLPPAIDHHVKPDLEFCAFCPFSYYCSYDPSIFEAV